MGHPDEMVYKFHWAPTAGFPLRSNTQMNADYFLFSPQRRGTTRIKSQRNVEYKDKRSQFTVVFSVVWICWVHCIH